jgi:hypothetical protein
MLMSRSSRCVLVLLFVAITAFPQSRREGVRSGPGTGDPYESLVPWHFLEKGGALINAPLVLYWLPASSQEVERSSLLSSPELVRDTARCLGFEIVLSEDAATIARFGETGKLPAVLLADAKGTVIRSVERSGGHIESAAVDKMVRDELNARDEAMYATMTEARKRVAGGDKQGAIELYRKLWDERCLFPLAGTEAQHALKNLGVIVVEPPAQIALDPNLTVLPKTPAKTTDKPKPAHGNR